MEHLREKFMYVKNKYGETLPLVKSMNSNCNSLTVGITHDNLSTSNKVHFQSNFVQTPKLVLVEMKTVLIWL